MVKILHDLWIITEDGIVLFNRVYNPQIETQLFGALLSAINTFAEEVSEGGLSHFELSNKQFVLLKKHTILFIANSPKKVKRDKISNKTYLWENIPNSLKNNHEKSGSKY